jgi:hypothetical protein
MADAVTSQILENGPQWYVAKFTNLSDGTGESGVKKVDASSGGPLGVVISGQTFYPTTNLKIEDIWWDVFGGALRIQWEASSAVDALVLSGYSHWPLRDTRAGFQGIVNPKTTGATGSILFTTVGFGANAGYTVILALRKGIPQS